VLAAPLEEQVSAVWFRHFAVGPVEWPWRSVTYGLPVPLRQLVYARLGVFTLIDGALACQRR
jgi:hypothetical protein